MVGFLLGSVQLNGATQNLNSSIFLLLRLKRQLQVQPVHGSRPSYRRGFYITAYDPFLAGGATTRQPRVRMPRRMKNDLNCARVLLPRWNLLIRGLFERLVLIMTLQALPCSFRAPKL